MSDVTHILLICFVHNFQCYTDFLGGRCTLLGSDRTDGRVCEPKPSRLHGAERRRHRYHHDETVGLVQASAEARRAASVVRL